MRSVLSACQDLARQHFLAIALGCVASLCAAQTSADPLATSYAGSYRRGSVDSSEQLVLLPDNTYCFAVMAGSLDLLSGGRWQAAPDNQPGIVLQEVKPTRPIFSAFVMNKPEQGAQVIFSFHGRSMACANAPVFGRKFGRKRDVSPKLAEDARKNCITPALYPDSTPASPRRDGSTLLLPKKDFYLNSADIDAKPWFDIKVKDAE